MPEYETMSHFSALINNAISHSSSRRTGTATITGWTRSPRPRRSPATWKSPANASIMKNSSHLLNDIAHSRGTGEELKQGSTVYAALKGRPDASIASRGSNSRRTTRRGAYGMALAYATSTRGACHLRAYPISHEILRKPVSTDRFSFSAERPASSRSPRT